MCIFKKYFPSNSFSIHFVISCEKLVTMKRISYSHKYSQTRNIHTENYYNGIKKLFELISQRKTVKKKKKNCRKSHCSKIQRIINKKDSINKKHVKMLIIFKEILLNFFVLYVNIKSIEIFLNSQNLEIKINTKVDIQKFRFKLIC